MKFFAEKVLTVVAKIPRGKTMTYAEVARRAGSPGAARAVGSVMKRNFDLAIPCHRVIRSDGSPGQYNRGGMQAKARKLRAEGALQQGVLALSRISGKMEPGNITHMSALEKKSESKRGKQSPDLLPHKKDVKVTFEAHRLEGKVKNMGIKNIGHQKKKPKV